MSATIIIGEPPLALASVEAIAQRASVVGLAAGAAMRIQRSYACMQALVQAATPIYGLTTGCGPLAGNEVRADEREQFQRNLIRSHAVGLGAPLPTAWVRAAMAVRTHVLAQGFSGVDPAAVELLVAMLNAGIHPIVREVGSVGASGDLVELAQIALALIGEGLVEFREATVPAAEALRAAGLEPLVPRYREGLALMNGTSLHTGAAAVLVVHARRALAAAEIAAAMVFDALRGAVEALAPALHAARPHPGQRAVAARVGHLVRDSCLVRTDPSAASQQDAYTLRCIPQVLGAASDVIDAAERTVTIELDAISDNPLFLADERRVVHGGNFHGQPVGMAIDQIKLALVEIGVMSERRVARLLDPALNRGLPAFLIGDGAGVRSGLMGVQYLASSMAADNAVLVAPASVRSVPTNANNQDVVSMGSVAARQAARVLDNVERMVAIELLCAAEGLDLRGVQRAGRGTRAVHALVREYVTPLAADRPLSREIEALVTLVQSGALERAAADR